MEGPVTQALMWGCGQAVSCLNPWSVTQDVPGPEQRTGPRFTSAVDLVKVSKFLHVGLCPVQLICPHPYLKSLTRNLPSPRHLGPGGGGGQRGRLESRRFGESGPGGSSGSILQRRVDMAVPTPTTCLRPLVTRRPSPRKRHSGSL